MYFYDCLNEIKHFLAYNFQGFREKMKYKKTIILLALVVFLLSIAGVSASEIGDTIASEDTGEIELSHEMESADNNLGTSEEQTVTQTDNEEKTGETDDGTFSALKSKIESASSGDTVYLENNYSCEDSWTYEDGISIYTSNLVIDGQGHTIDAKQKTRIFLVDYVENVTIKNIKFINAKLNSDEGAAILWYESANGRVSGCSFVNCSADDTGGAIQWSNSANGRVSGCSFVNCSAVYGGAIYWDNSANGIISDCAFIKCTASYGKAIRIWISSVSLDRNWFGNTAENYESSPNAYIEGAGLDNWLFLNATVDPDSISIAETADIIFKLYLYNGSISDYTSLAKVDLTLNSNGKLDKNVTGLDEKVTFTPTSLGTGSVTATIGDVAYTTTLTVTTDGTTFWDLNQTINGNTNATINLDKNYTFNPASDSAFTEGIDINRPVTINGNGHTLDAKGQARIFNVQGNNVTINNITFVNGKYDGTGGAIFWSGANGTVSGSSFTGNSANSGGAIFWYGANGTVSGSSFTGNNANGHGGAIVWNAANGNVSNSIFINNAANSEGDAIYGNRYLIADYCWFGGNATNYKDDLPIAQAAYCYNILFLNATANPAEVPAFSTSEIVFKLYLYNRTSGNISEYDNTLLLPINLTVTSTNGDVDIHTVNLGESIRYTATSRGTGSITASIENVKYTIETTNLGLNPDLLVDSQEADYSNRTIIAINYNSSATGTVNITLKGKNGNNYTFTNFALNATILLPEVINADEYDVNVTYSGDNVFLNATATGKLTINKANSTLTINDNVTFDYNINGSTTVSYANASGVNASVVGQPNAIVVVNDTTITVSGLNAGNYTLTVTTITDANHNNITKNATITVNKLQTQLSGNAITATYNVNKDLVITLKDANGNALSGVNVIVDLNGAKTYTTDSNGQVKVSTKGLAPNVYTAKVTFNGNTNYDKSTKDIKVTVKKATPKLTAKKKTFKTSVKTKKYIITLKDNTGKAIKKAKVTLKVKGKTYKATTNSKGKAVFKIKNLKKKGTFKATITYKGNKYYNKVSKKAKIKVIVTFKTVSKGSKDKSTVKEIQQALKDHGYYLSYKGHYLKVDGKFKGCTERSVKEFQKDKGLKVTGKVDEKTAKKLGLI